MRIHARKALGLAFAMSLIAAGAFWATSSLSAAPERAMLPVAESMAYCPPVHPEECFEGCTADKEVTIDGLGTFQTKSTGSSPMIARVGRPFLRNGVKTVPLQLISLDGTAFAEGVGETRFWLDASRPVTSAVWERVPSTEFPAIQEVRFHFFYTVDAMPDKVYRSMNPAIMRTDNLHSFPPPPGTPYRLVSPVNLEEISQPGVVAGRVVDNQVVIPEPRPKDPRVREFRGR